MLLDIIIDAYHHFHKSLLPCSHILFFAIKLAVLLGIAKFSSNFNVEKATQSILNLSDEKLLETKRKIKLVSNVKKE